MDDNDLLDVVKRLRGYLATHPDYQKGYLEAQMAMDQADGVIKVLQSVVERIEAQP